MVNPYHFLILEDRSSDAELIVLELKRSGFEFEWQRVDNKEGYLAALNNSLDLIIADYVLPQFDAVHALNLLKEKSLNIPLIVVSGNISEETAVNAVKLGAVDYLLKDRLTRLGQAVNNALEQRKVLAERQLAQKALKESEERFRRLAENAQDIIYRFRFSPQRYFEYISPAVATITGYSPEEFYTNHHLLNEIVLPEDRYLLESVPTRMAEKLPLTIRWCCKDGKIIWVEQRDVYIFDDAGELEAIEGIARDITERIRNHHELEIIVSLSHTVRKAQTRNELIAVILDQILDLLQANGSALIFKDLYSGEGVVELARGLLERMTGDRIPPGEGISGTVISSGEIFLSNDLLTDPFNQIINMNGDLHGIACAPLVSQNLVIGAMMITRHAPIDAYEARLLTAVADIAANAIQRTTLHEKTIFHAHQMEAVSEIGRALAEALDRTEIYRRLDQSLLELIPGICELTISSYDSGRQLFTVEYASRNGVLSDVNQFEQDHLKPPGVGTKSEAIIRRQPIIRNQLADHKKINHLKVRPGDAIPQSGLYVPMISRNEIIGVIEVQSMIPNRFSEEDARALSLVGNTAAVAIQNTRLLKDLQQNNLDLILAYNSTLEGWSRALDLRDGDTGIHSQYVAEMAVELARSLGIGGDELINIQRGALLHDLGKIGISDLILRKAGSLTPEEWEIMRRHPQFAYDMLLPITYLKDALDIPYSHHEKWDGSGYPRGLKGEQIPLAARIFALVDVWNALLQDRPYRKAWDKERVIQYISEQGGIHFDPSITRAFLNMVMNDEEIAI